MIVPCKLITWPLVVASASESRASTCRPSARCCELLSAHRSGPFRSMDGHAFRRARWAAGFHLQLELTNAHLMLTPTGHVLNVGASQAND